MRHLLLRPVIAAPVVLALLALAGCVGDSAPIIGTATAGDGQAVVSWQPPRAVRKEPVTAYVVTPWIGFERQTPVVFNSTATTQTVTGLTNGVTYGFTVHAVDADGNETTESNMSNRITPAAHPTWPITDVGAGPPPIPVMPAAGDPPPADVIGDPITPGAGCGDWHLQSHYGDRWVGGSTWWEYQCTYQTSVDYPHPCGGGACSAVCYGYPFDCYSVTDEWTDYFSWNGASAVFYGQAYANTIDDYGTGSGSAWAAWWDAPTAQWYSDIPAPITLSVSTMGRGSGVATQGLGSGTVTSNPGGIDCGATCQARFVGEPVVTLTATPTDASSAFDGWSGDCSGTGPCQVTMDQSRSVTASFRPNLKELVVYPQGDGGGTVTSNPAGIDCRTTYPHDIGGGVGECEANFVTGTVVTLTATAAPASTFTGWSGDCTGMGPCQVTLDRNRWASPTFASNVPNQLPTARFTVACAALACHFDASASTDTDGTIVAYQWTFGDSSGSSNLEPTVDHTYYGAGTYTAALTVVDDRVGRTTSAPQTVTLTNVAPTASFTSACTGLTCTFDGSGSTDSDGTIITWWWDFGDGGCCGGGNSTTHTYATAGSYTVQLHVMDNGHLTATDSHTVTIQ